MGLIDDFLARLRKANPQEQESFLQQLTKEKTVLDALKRAGYTVQATNTPQGKPPEAGSFPVVQIDPTNSTETLKGAYATIFNPDTGGFEYQRTITKLPINGAGAAGDNVIWTPAKGKKFRLLGFLLTIPIGSTTAASQVVSIKDGVGGTAGAIMSFNISIGALAALTQPIILLVMLPSNGCLSSKADNPLNVNLLCAMTAGGVQFSGWGCEE